MQVNRGILQQMFSHPYGLMIFSEEIPRGSKGIVVIHFLLIVGEGHDSLLDVESPAENGDDVAGTVRNILTTACDCCADCACEIDPDESLNPQFVQLVVQEFKDSGSVSTDALIPVLA